MPRNNELDEALDFDVKRAAYFRQMRYGLYVSLLIMPFALSVLTLELLQVRMALLTLVLGNASA